MTDDELEQRLRAHYRAIDPGEAPRGLGIRIGDALERRPSRPAFSARMRPAFAAALAAVVIVAVGLGFGLRPGGFLSSPGASPTATASPQLGSPVPSASPSPTPTLPLPSGSVPPISTTPWSGLQLQALEGGPVSASSVVAWSGGYLALGLASDQAPLPAWVSHDGRSWAALPPGTFGPAIRALAVPCAAAVLVAVQSATGQTTVWHSTDGVTWTPSPSSQMRLAPEGDLAGNARDRDLAGNASGAVAILAGSPYRLVFSADGVAWQTVSLPGSSASSVQGVTAFGTGFIAVGDAGTQTGSPVAWWSADGLHWTLAAVQPRPGDGFNDVHAASHGLVAFSDTRLLVPGLASFWTSPDGRSWTVSTADPLGLQWGAGEGSANGTFLGDGTRLLGYGARGPGQPTEYWVSFDGTQWTKLALSGEVAAAVAGQARPFLLRDGVLFGGDQGSWLGAGVK